MKIVFTDYKTLGFPFDTQKIKAFGDVKIYDNLSGDALSEALIDAEVVITNQNRLDQKSLSKAASLKLICEAATGYDNIDLEYCREKKIAVTNVPGYAGKSVAQHTFAMLFYLLSHSRYYDDYVKNGNYAAESYADHTGKEFFELEGKTWGILGKGNIGSLVASYAESFGCRVISSPFAPDKEFDNNETFSLPELLRVSDIISIHAPLSAKTYHLIEEKELRLMKKSAILLNLGRGGIINEGALARALDEGTIYSAGLDVLEQEPIAKDNPLLQIKNKDRIYITPHIAYGSMEARTRLIDAVCDNIESFVNGGSLNRIENSI